MATLYRPSEIAAIARAGDRCAQILTEAASEARSGASAAAIDTLVRRRITEAGAAPILLELTGPAGSFPGAISISTGPGIANAPPRAESPPPGAIVRLDLALRLDGWIADAATSLIVEPATPDHDPDPARDHDPDRQARRLIAAARAVTEAVAGALRPGARWCDVLRAGRAAAAATGVHIADWPWGHGVGRRLHEPPALPADPSDPAADFTLRPGMVLALEPIVLSRPARLQIAPDGWTLTAADGGAPPLAACEERTVAVGDHAPQILTPLP